jgi:hypothetical protein
VLVIIYFVNQKHLGEFRAGAGRNIVLALTALFALALVANGIRGLL